MKTSILALAALMSTLVVAQYQGIPDCARDCVNNSLPKSCNGDVTCICTDASFISNVSCCISQVCQPADQQKALDTARGLCSGSNVALPSAAGCVSSAGTSSTSSGASAGAASSTAATTTAASTTSRSASSTTSSAAAASTTSPSPGNKLTVNGMRLAGALFGAVALL